VKLLALLATMLVAGALFWLTGSWLVAGLTGLIGGLAYAHDERRRTTDRAV
jgi:uncharacterized membrane protein